MMPMEIGLSSLHANNYDADTNEDPEQPCKL